LEQIVAEVIAGLVAAMVGHRRVDFRGTADQVFNRCFTGLSSQLNGIIDESFPRAHILSLSSGSKTLTISGAEAKIVAGNFLVTGRFAAFG